MKLRVHPFRLTDRYVWRCAREAIPVQDGLLIELEQHGVSGFGEASAFMVERYNAGLAAMSTALRRVEPLLLDLDPSNAGCIRQVVGSQLADDPFVRSALDCAVHDLPARLPE